MVSIKQYNFSPTYLKDTGSERDFQKEMEAFAIEKNHKICILDAPTAAGKTHGFKLMSQREGFTIIVLPNNLLAREVFKKFKEDTSVALLTGPEIEKVMLEQKKAGFLDFTKRRAVGQIINNNKIIITNPTVFYSIILNFYFFKRKNNEDKNRHNFKGDHLSQLISQGLRMIIFDEFHVYSRDQKNVIFAIIATFRQDIKIMFASATLPPSLVEFCHELFGKETVKYIGVKREYIKTEYSKVIQGPIVLKICSGIGISEFIEAYHSELNEGNWFIIADSIRNMDRIFKTLKKFFNENEIAMVSAYHDPKYEAYTDLNFGSVRRRFVIGSSVIEQGINPPENYNNFILEPGLGIDNLMQRMGRVGRGVDTLSKVYVIIKSKINEWPEITKIDDFYLFFQKFYRNNQENSFIKRFIGAYIGAIVDNLSFGLKNIILQNMKSQEELKSLLPFIYAYLNISRILSSTNSSLFNTWRRSLRNIENISLWWKDYSESIKRFIPFQKQTELLDITLETENNGFITEYNDIWLRRNKEIIRKESGLLIIGEFLDSLNNNFQVEVNGIPFNSKTRMRYDEISPYRARYGIKKAYDEWENQYSYNISSTQETKRFFDDIKMIIDATADFERLRIDTVD